VYGDRDDLPAKTGFLATSKSTSGRGDIVAVVVVVVVLVVFGTRKKELLGMAGTAVKSAIEPMT
jgi:hypothetical protein